MRHLIGRVTGEDRKTGLQGLVVELVSVQPQPTVLAEARTNASGRFSLRWAGSRGERARLRVRPPGAPVLHEEETASRARSLQVSLPVPIDKRVRARRFWSPPQGPLIDAGLVATLRSVARSQSREDSAFLPWLTRYDHLLGDAWATLLGDPSATDRFRWALEEVSRRYAMCPAPDFVQGRVPNFWKQIDEASGSGATWEAISHDAATVLVLGAIWAGAGSPARLDRYVATVLGELGRLQRLDPIVRELRRGGPQQASVLFPMLGNLEGCGPDDGPVPPWDQGRPPKLDPCLRDFLLGLAEGWPRIEGMRLPIWYRVDSVSPATACSGTIVTISGTNFGTTPGTVLFPRRTSAGGGTVEVVAATWSDTVVTAVVPAEAGCGLVYLRIPGGGAGSLCGKIIYIYRQGTSQGTISAGVPDIRRFVVDGATRITVAPGATVTLAWDVCGTTNPINITLRTAGGALVTTFAGLPSSGNVVVTLPTYANTTEIHPRLDAVNLCGASVSDAIIVVHRVATAYLTGLELTQATQFFRGTLDPGTTPASLGRDNSVPLIANKPTLARVYLATDQAASFNGGRVIGCRVELYGWLDGNSLPGSPLTSMVSPVDARRDNSVSAQRGSLSRSANFRLPGSWTAAGGAYRFEAVLTLPDNSPETVDVDRDEARVDGVFFSSARTLDIVLVRINYQGAGGPAAAPTHADAITTLQYVRRAYPTHDLRVFVPDTADQVITYRGDLTDGSGGGCGAGWNGLIDRLDGLAKDYDGDDDMVWCGVLGAGIPTNVATGCGTGDSSHAFGIALFRNGDGTTAAQEVGHAFDLDHTFDPIVFGVSTYANYPNYGYADRDSIGEFGVEVERVIAANATTGLYNPATASDFMSYDSAPLWTSPDTYQDLMIRFTSPFAFLTTIGIASETHRVGDGRAEHLMICGTLHEGGDVRLRPLYHLPVRRYRPRGNETRYRLVLVDEKGATLEDYPLVSMTGARGRITISQAIPFSPGARALEVRDESGVLTRVERPTGQPKITKISMRRQGRAVVVGWEGSHPQGRTLLYGVAFSCDGGRSWRRVAKALRKATLSIPTTRLAGGADCRFRVIATDGFNTAYADTRRFSLPERPLEIVPLLSPRYAAGAPQEFSLEVVRPLGYPSEQTEVRWRSDRQGPLGDGKQMSCTLEPGRHVLSISTTVRRSTTTTTVVVDARPQPEPGEGRRTSKSARTSKRRRPR